MCEYISIALECFFVVRLPCPSMRERTDSRPKETHKVPCCSDTRRKALLLYPTARISVPLSRRLYFSSTFTMRLVSRENDNDLSQR